MLSWSTFKNKFSFNFIHVNYQCNEIASSHLSLIGDKLVTKNEFANYYSNVSVFYILNHNNVYFKERKFKKLSLYQNINYFVLSKHHLCPFCFEHSFIIKTRLVRHITFIIKLLLKLSSVVERWLSFKSRSF